MKTWIITYSILILPLLTAGQSPKKFSRLAPHHVKLQFAGSIGFLSGGFGYESARKKLQYDFFYGYVPEKIGGVAIHSVTGKMTWILISKQLKKGLRIDPLITGFLVNYTFGKQYFLFKTPYYPGFYYGFPTAAHLGIFIGSNIKKNRLGLYYELGTHAKDLASYVTNTRTLDFVDILNIGIGARLDLHKDKRSH